MPHSGRCRDAALTVVWCTLTACSNDPGALYCDPGECLSDDAGDAPRAAPPEPPWLPALPDQENIAACAACAKEKCVEARSSCLDDDQCTALLRCKGEADNPAALQECEADHGFSAWYADLWACVINEACTTDCKAGENWGCAGNYDWPAATENRFPVTYRFENPRTSAFLGGDNRVETYWVGAEARTCVADSECLSTEVLDSGRVDASDSVKLEVFVPGFIRSFTGVLEVEDPDIGSFGLGERYLGAPLSSFVAVAVFLGDRGFLQAASAGAIDLDRGAPLTLTVDDCLGVRGRGMRFELPDLPEVEALHALLPGWGQGPSPVGYAFVTDVPEPQRKRVRVRAVRDEARSWPSARPWCARAGRRTWSFGRARAEELSKNG